MWVCYVVVAVDCWWRRRVGGIVSCPLVQLRRCKVNALVMPRPSCCIGLLVFVRLEVGTYK